jgi:chemotaxis signal transduction protein
VQTQNDDWGKEAAHIRMIATPTVAPAAQRYCLFRRGALDFALPVRVAGRAVPARPLTRVPFAPPDFCGVFLDRRRVVPVVLLDRWLGLPGGARSRKEVWLMIDDGTATLAGVVDELRGVAAFTGREVKRALAHPMASGMVTHESRTVVLLDPVRLVPTITGTLLAALPQAGAP